MHNTTASPQAFLSSPGVRQICFTRHCSGVSGGSLLSEKCSCAGSAVLRKAAAAVAAGRLCYATSSRSETKKPQPQSTSLSHSSSTARSQGVSPRSSTRDALQPPAANRGGVGGARGSFDVNKESMKQHAGVSFAFTNEWFLATCGQCFKQ